MLVYFIKRASFDTRSPCSLKRRNDINLADDVLVEGGEFFRRDPEFLVDGVAHGLHGVAQNEIGADAEARHVARAGVPGVPVARDLDGVVHVEHRIKNRLPRQAHACARWKRAITTHVDQFKLLRPHRPEEG
jgi:hypothetical protein